jgi:hypothetical protein
VKLGRPSIHDITPTTSISSSYSQYKYHTCREQALAFWAIAAGVIVAFRLHTVANRASVPFADPNSVDRITPSDVRMIASAKRGHSVETTVAATENEPIEVPSEPRSAHANKTGPLGLRKAAVALASRGTVTLALGGTHCMVAVLLKPRSLCATANNSSAPAVSVTEHAAVTIA